jgi:hypothetical protein
MRMIVTARKSARWPSGAGDEPMEAGGRHGSLGPG